MLVVSQDTSVVAQFKAKVYRLTILAGKGGKLKDINGDLQESITVDCPYNTGYTVEAVPDEHYHLAKWSDGEKLPSSTMTAAVLRLNNGHMAVRRSAA